MKSQDLQKLEVFLLTLREKCQSEEEFKDKLQKLPIEYLEIINKMEKAQLKKLLNLIEVGEF